MGDGIRQRPALNAAQESALESLLGGATITAATEAAGGPAAQFSGWGGSAPTHVRWGPAWADVVVAREDGRVRTSGASGRT